MEGQKIFENDSVSCYLDDSIPVLQHRWLCRPTNEEFKENLLNMLDIYKYQKKTYPSLMWLADTSLMGEITQDTEDWLANEWDRLLFDEAGVKVHAVVLSSDLFSDYPMELFQRKSEQRHADQGVHLGVFASIDSAYEWLKQFN